MQRIRSMVSLAVALQLCAVTASAPQVLAADPNVAFPLRHAVGLAVGGTAAPAGEGLYFADYGRCCGPGDDGRVRVLRAGVLRSLPARFADPVALVFGQGGGFGEDLYVVDNNWTDIFRGRVFRIAPDGTRTAFTGDLDDPVSAEVLTGTAFGDLMAVAGIEIGPDAPGVLMFVDPAGDVVRRRSLGRKAVGAGLAVDRTGRFGGRLFVAVSGREQEPDTSGGLKVVTPGGWVGRFATDRPIRNPLSLAFSPGGSALIVSARGDGTRGSGEVVAVDRRGHVTVLVSGLTFWEGPSALYPDGDLAIDGHSIHVLERSTGLVLSLPLPSGF